MENNKQMENNRPPKDYLVWAVLTTIFCCIPFGVVSIIHSCRVNGLYRDGRYDEAVEEAGQAKKWAIWALIAGIAQYVIVIIYYVVVMCAAVALGAE